MRGWDFSQADSMEERAKLSFERFLDILLLTASSKSALHVQLLLFSSVNLLFGSIT